MRPKVPLLPAVVRWSLVAAVVAIIFYGSVLTAPPATPLDSARLSLIPLDKWRHFLAYAALAGTLSYALADRDIETRTLIAIVLGVVVVYGVGIEFAQLTQPNRDFSIADAYADALGGLLVAPLLLLRPYVAFVPLSGWFGPGERTSREG